MKKLLLSTLVTCMALFVSCKKDSTSTNGGGNTPAKKTLSEIYGTYNYKEYTSQDHQNWELTYEGNCDSALLNEYIYENGQLVTINYYTYSGALQQKLTMTYSEEGIVTRINEHSYDDFGNDYAYHYDLLYDNELLTRIEYYYTENNHMISTYDLSYINNKLNTVIRTDLYSDKSASITPRKNRFNLFERLNDNRSELNYTYVYEITWTGDNITQVRETGDDFEIFISYDYDNKINPYNENTALIAISFAWLDFASLSKNNVTYYAYAQFFNVTSSYNYDDNYPIEQVSIAESSETYAEGVWYKSIETHTSSYIYQEK